MLNRCEFIGNLGQDPEVRNVPNGGKVVNLSIGVTEKWKDGSGERKERTEWIKAVIFSDGLCRVAEQYLRKGSRVYIAGQMQTRKWQDQSGQDRYSTEIVLQNFGGQMVLLDSHKGSASAPQEGQGFRSPEPRGAFPDDDLPF